MQSTAFRLITALAAVLLPAALIVVIQFALRNPPPPAAPITPSMPTPSATALSTPAPGIMATAPASTAVANGATATKPAIGARVPITAAGFTYIAPRDYAVASTESTVTLTKRNPASTLSTIFLLSGGPATQFVDQPAAELDELLGQFVDYFSEQDNFTAGEVRQTQVDGVEALAVDLVSQSDEAGFVGRIVMAQPEPGRLFVMNGIAPADAWETAAADEYETVLTSIRMLAPTPGSQTIEDASALLVPTATATATRPPTPPPTVTPIPASQPLPTPDPDVTLAPDQLVYANANFVREGGMARGVLWLATDGGIIARNGAGGTFVKFTPLQGLARNHAASIAYCPLPGLGVVLGGEGGLQVFDTRNGTWNTLNSANSGMSYDDVATVRCAVDDNLLVVGYQQHGLDLYNAAGNEWTHIDRNGGLANDFVERVAVAASGRELWVSSGFGLTVLADEIATYYNVDNSPLVSNQIDALVTAPNGNIWLSTPDTVYRVDNGRWTALDPSTVADPDFPRGPLAGLAPLADGTVWVGSTSGDICHLDPDEQRCIAAFDAGDGLAGTPLTSLLADDLGNVYYTTAGAGIGVLEDDRWRQLTVPGEALADNTVYSLVRDRAGFVWVAGNGGIQQISPQETAVTRLYTHSDNRLPIAEAQTLAPGIPRGVWAGGFGAAYFDGDEWQTFDTADGLAGNVVHAIATDNQLRTWIGTKTGLSIWNGESFFNLTRDTGLPSENITALLPQTGAMWIGSNGGGLFRFEQNQLRLFNSENADLPSNTVSALALMSDGRILVGTTRGLAFFADDRAEIVTETPDDTVTALASDGAGHIWVGFAHRGVYYYDGAQWQRQTGIRALPSEQIGALHIDQYGSLWIGGLLGGITRDTRPVP